MAVAAKKPKLDIWSRLVHHGRGTQQSEKVLEWINTAHPDHYGRVAKRFAGRRKDSRINAVVDGLELFEPGAVTKFPTLVVVTTRRDEVRHVIGELGHAQRESAG